MLFIASLINNGLFPIEGDVAMCPFTLLCQLNTESPVSYDEDRSFASNHNSKSGMCDIKSKLFPSEIKSPY